MLFVTLTGLRVFAPTACRRVVSVDPPGCVRTSLRPSTVRGVGRWPRVKPPVPLRAQSVAASLPRTQSSTFIAPSLSSGSFPLPHLGDCTQDGQP